MGFGRTITDSCAAAGMARRLNERIQNSLRIMIRPHFRGQAIQMANGKRQSSNGFKFAIGNLKYFVGLLFFVCLS
jgi:hypothetical protein